MLLELLTIFKNLALRIATVCLYACARDDYGFTLNCMKFYGVVGYNLGTDRLDFE